MVPTLVPSNWVGKYYESEIWAFVTQKHEKKKLKKQPSQTVQIDKTDRNQTDKQIDRQTKRQAETCPNTTALS